MSAEQNRARVLAERIAHRLSPDREEGNNQSATSSHDVGEELRAVRASLNDLQKRLAHIESHIAHENEDAAPAHTERDATQSYMQREATAPSTRSPWLSGMYVPAAHPSQERFDVNEATVSELVDFFEKEKTCSVEPGGKPCDHCAMCSSRGF
ncbi:MAG: hypothetical protein AUG51_10850 [Acidobacteria bacterium 13_1_20CM_3_53_8]|nr:MAG: hypothetical protein AUG51_10850 [Acidobacteria bacterium 13_1_20CM_3_53_8]